MQDNLAFYASLAPKEDSCRYECRTRLLYTGTKGRPEQVFRSGMKTSINSFKNDSFRIICLTLVSYGNRIELVLEQNSFRYHVKGP